MNVPARSSGLYGPSPPVAVREAFLDALAASGNVMATCGRLGLPRQTAYAWRYTDQEFSNAWDRALDIFRDQVASEVMDTARALGVGTWRPALDEDGRPVLDADFEPVLVLDVSNVDNRILSKMIDKTMRSVDAPAQTNVLVHATTNVGVLPPAPRIVRTAASTEIIDVVASEVTEATTDQTLDPGEHS